MTPAWDRTRPGVCDSEKLVRVGGFMAGVRCPVHATDAVTDTKLMDMELVDPYVSPTNGLGSWIWASNTYDGQVCQFWRAFEVPGSSAVTNARLTVPADNEFTLYLDGRELGRGAEWRELFVFDLTQSLISGEHVLMA